MDSEINTKLLLEIDFVLLSHFESPVTLFSSQFDEPLIIESLQDLPLDQEFLTENNNKLCKKSKHEALLISPIGEKIEIKIDNKEEIIVPVLLDRSRASLDPALTHTAEAVLEDLTGKSLFSGIPIFLQNFNSGKLIFSLKEIPLDETYCTENGHTLKRNNLNQFFIDDVQYEPANETHLLSGEPLLPSSGGRERSRSRSNSLPSFANRFKSKSFSILSPTNARPQVNQQDSDWNFLVTVDENNALLVTELQTFDDIMETARKRKIDHEARFAKMMERYSQHYSHNDKMSDQETANGQTHELEPLLDKIDDDCPFYQTLYFSNLVKSLQGNKIAADAVKSVPVTTEGQSNQNKSPERTKAQDKTKSKSFNKPK